MDMPVKRVGNSFIMLVKGEKRRPHEIKRRMDFSYMGGHGTFYRYARKHPPKDVLEAKKGQKVKLVLYNLHTKQLDEVHFRLKSRITVGGSVKFVGNVSDMDAPFEIEGYIHETKKLNRMIKTGTVLVRSSGEKIIPNQFPK